MKYKIYQPIVGTEEIIVEVDDNLTKEQVLTAYKNGELECIESTVFVDHEDISSNCHIEVINQNK